VGWTHDRARVAALTRYRNPDDPELSDARRDLAAARLTEAVRRAVATAPPLSAEQIEKLRGLLPYPHPCAPLSGDRGAITPCAPLSGDRGAITPCAPLSGDRGAITPCAPPSGDRGAITS
jgi:hypothetical protein